MSSSLSDVLGDLDLTSYVSYVRLASPFVIRLFFFPSLERFFVPLAATYNTGLLKCCSKSPVLLLQFFYDKFCSHVMV